jgi:hypothetical protein
MEKFDFVIQDLVTADYYYYFSGDPEAITVVSI